jgi:hypothetical protein
MTVTKTYYHRSGGHRAGVSGSARWDERGEGVISAAIAVLVMAFIGVAMWVAFDTTFQHAAKHVDNQVNCIGQSSSSC